MGESLISVIVPIYNAQPYLGQCLNSIVGQTYKNLEIILLNDGSTDDSLTTIHRFAGDDARIKVVDKQNQGYGATCNRGIAEATGTWISIVEPDDWIEPDMYADMLAFAAKFEEEGTPLDIVKTPYWRIWMPDTDEERRLNAATKAALSRRSSRLPSPMPPICFAIIRPFGRQSIANRSWTSTTSASGRFQAPAGQTTRS